MAIAEDQNYIQRAYSALRDLIHGRAFAPPLGGPGGSGTANMVVSHRAILYAVEALAGLLGAAREHALALGRSQADPDPARREGIGIVEGRFEQWPVATPGAHDSYHLTPSVAIALTAHRHRDHEMRDVWLRVIGRWLAMWRIGRLPDGANAPGIYTPATVGPGTRWWPHKKKPPKLSADGLVRLPPDTTPHLITDSCYRLLAGLSQRDSRGRAQPSDWVMGHDEAGWAAAQGLLLLEREGARVPRDLDARLFARIQYTEVQDGTGGWRRRLWLDKTKEEVGGSAVQGYVPAVQVVWRPGEPVDIGWSPNVVPEEFAIAGAPLPFPIPPEPPKPPALELVSVPRAVLDRAVDLLRELEGLAN